MEATRIIPISASRPALAPQFPATSPRTASDPGLIKIDSRQGRTAAIGGDMESSQRFASEVQYVSFYATKLADTLGMHRLQLGVVEDREGQTAFHATTEGWQGVVSGNRRSLKQVREALMRG